MRQSGVPSLIRLKAHAPVLMPDGKTDYHERMDSIHFAAGHHEDLPFLAWSIGRHDGYSTWQEQVDMVKALTAGHHGFAMAWNNGNHSEGAAPMDKVLRFYPPEKFALHKSYPAFGNSSLDDQMGTGQLVNKVPKDGDSEGGINLGFFWTDPVDTRDEWSVSISNELARAEMTVDVTPRRCQQFLLKKGEKVTWTNSAGGSGSLIADAWGFVTIPRVHIAPGAPTILTIRRSM